METSKTLSRLDAPGGWAELLRGALKVAIVAFVILNVKEYVDAGSFDAIGTGTDALLIAAGVLVVNATLRLVRARF